MILVDWLIKSSLCAFDMSERGGCDPSTLGFRHHENPVFLSVSCSVLFGGGDVTDPNVRRSIAIPAENENLAPLLAM